MRYEVFAHTRLIKTSFIDAKGPSVNTNYAVNGFRSLSGSIVQEKKDGKEEGFT
jgi:hypothetical protein